jgi:hypothetical protein
MNIKEANGYFWADTVPSDDGHIWTPCANGIVAPAITLLSVRTACDFDVPSGMDMEFDFYDRRTGISYRKVTIHLENGEWGELDFGSMEQNVTFEPGIATLFRDAVLNALLAWVRHSYGQLQHTNRLLSDYERITRELVVNS